MSMSHLPKPNPLFFLGFSPSDEERGEGREEGREGEGEGGGEGHSSTSFSRAAGGRGLEDVI